MSAPCARSDSPTTDSAALLTALVVITAAAAIRLAIAAVFPLPPDETYYWEWSRHLASGYFDHPPGVALLVRAGVSLFGDTPIGVRAGAIAAGWGASLAVVLLANRLGGARAALRAGAIITCMPLAAAGLMLATPDAPLLVTVALTLLALDGAVAAPPGSARSLAWWLGAGLALGAAFLSKYNAALLPLTVLVALLTAPALRRHLATPAPYLAAAVALLVFAPVVAWNAHHDWISFRFQLLHGLGPARGSVIEREGDLLGGQLALVSPVLLPLLALAVARSLRPAAPRVFLLAVVAAAIFLFFCVSALRQPAEANWQAPAYVPAIVVLAIVANTPRWRRWLAVACAVAGTMTAAMYIQAVHPFLPIAAADDPTARGTGWKELATRMTAIAAAHPAPPGARTWFGGDRYQEASELAFHLPGHPTTFSLNLGGRANAYDAWPPFPERARPGDNLVLALEITAHGTEDSVAVLLRPHFERAQLVSTVGLYRGRELRDERHIWILRGWRGTWPAVACRSCLPGRGPGISAHGRSSVLASPVR